MTIALSKAEFQYGGQLPAGGRDVADYAASRVPSRGRIFEESACPTRNDLQRDRDRILHSTAFRRLTYKTQMFVYHEGDHYRTRLTHSLEVAQIARTIARQLCLDEDLAEAIALGHDLGHPPFGHAGGRALDAAFSDAGGFDHNVQSFRIVTALERKYARFDGLNLTWETLEGLAKHNGPPALGRELGDQRFVRAVRDFEEQMDLQLSSFASGEAQVAAIADDIAWHTHDIDDGLRAGLIKRENLQQVAIVQPLLGERDVRGTDDPMKAAYEVTRRLIALIITDAVKESRKRLARLKPASPDDIRQAETQTVCFSSGMQAQLDELRTFLFANLYHHDTVMDVMNSAEKIVADLAERYTEKQAELPEAWQAGFEGLDYPARRRRVADFVAGMTDRFAISEHQRLFDVTPELR